MLLADDGLRHAVGEHGDEAGVGFYLRVEGADVYVLIHFLLCVVYWLKGRRYHALCGRAREK